MIAFVEAVDAELWNSLGDGLRSFLGITLLLPLQLFSGLLYRLHNSSNTSTSARLK